MANWQSRDRVPICGPALEAARERAGWSREKLAAELGVSYKTVERYERGERKPTKATVARLCALLGMSLAALLVPAEAPRPG